MWQLFKPDHPDVPAKLAPRKYKPRRVPPDYLSTTEKRLAMALAKDNGGVWWVASTSKYDLIGLERMFAEGAAPGLLYEAVGGILGKSDLVDEGYIFLQILDDDPTVPFDLVRCTLEDLDVRLLEPMGHAPLMLQIPHTL